MKLMAFAQGQIGMDRSQFQQSCLSDLGPAWLKADPSLRRLVVNLLDVRPGKMPWQRPDEEIAPPGADKPPYDAVIEAWLDSAEQARAASQWLTKHLGGTCSKLDVFGVTEWIEKDRTPPAGRGTSPGVKYISQCSFHDDLPDSAAQRSWQVHVPLALRVHVGVSKYVRNWVEERLSSNTGSTRGIVELHFDSMQDLEQRWFASEHGKAEITHDVRHFLKGAVRMFTTEHILLE